MDIDHRSFQVQLEHCEAELESCEAELESCEAEREALAADVLAWRSHYDEAIRQRDALAERVRVLAEYYEASEAYDDETPPACDTVRERLDAARAAVEQEGAG